MTAPECGILVLKPFLGQSLVVVSPWMTVHLSSLRPG